MDTVANGRDAPPRTLEQLRSLVARIQSKQATTKLGGRALRALASIVASPGHTAMSSISEVAAAAGVNASTLSRLSRRLGYGGFNDFQDVFRHHLYRASGFHGERASEWLQVPAARADSILLRIARDEAKNIAATVEQIDYETLQAAATRLIEARRVRTFGARQMHAVACFLAYGLGMLRNDVDLLVPSGQGIAHGLAQLDADDALVIVSCAPYARPAMDTARMAAAQGLRVVALTDSSASPLAGLAERSFACETGGSLFGNSMAALFVVAEALLTVAAENMGARSLQQLRRREALINEMGVDL